MTQYLYSRTLNPLRNNQTCTMSNKRAATVDMKSLLKKAKIERDESAAARANQGPRNKYLSTAIQPDRALAAFLVKARNSARNFLPKEHQKFPVEKPFCEIEARLGILKVPHAQRRVTSSGAKRRQETVVKAFDCTNHKCQMISGVNRSHYTRWTSSGLSELSPLTTALGVTKVADLKTSIKETEYVETVYSGYPQDKRLCYDGLHEIGVPSSKMGKMEAKQKLAGHDMTIPAASYDMRIGLACEKILDHNVSQPPPGWTSRRVKRRRSYERRDRSFAWQIDVTEVSTTVSSTGETTVDFEIELELNQRSLLQLINKETEEQAHGLASQLASQLWWMLTQLNPLHDALDVEECLRPHPNKQEVDLAKAHCSLLKKFVDSGSSYMPESPITNRSEPPSRHLVDGKFIGCMPVSFSRHNIDDIQRSPSSAYYMSEKTDGVRYLLVSTGTTVVLLDRKMDGKQPISKDEPFATILKYIKPGTVLDGEVVMNRHGRSPRPIFIVFDVLSTSAREPVLHLPFAQRLNHLYQASFRTLTASADSIFNPAAVADASIPLPLIQKSFVKRTAVDDLFARVVEERGMRCYKKGPTHNHLTDGIIFQPNKPYVCGTDVNLLKWKYLDTTTVDVEIQPSMDDDTLHVCCLGEEQTRVDMTRHVVLPRSERLKLEADRFETGGKIAEVGLDPETGEWYYLTMRADKTTPNHIGTVLGTLLELGESVTSDELRYRMSVPAGNRDTFRKDMRGMFKQLLDFQRKSLQKRKPI